MNKNIATMGRNECKDVLLNNACIKHPMNRIQSKHHSLGKHEINKFHFLALMTKYISKTIDLTD